MTDNSGQQRPSTPPPPPPFPLHPKQAQLIAGQQQPESISPPKVTFKSSFGEQRPITPPVPPPPPPPLPPHPKQAQLIADQQQPERIIPPRVTFKSSFGEKSDDPLTNTSPVSKLNLEAETKADQTAKPPKKQEELIEAPYLKRILSGGIQSTDADRPPQQPQEQPTSTTRAPISSTVPACCYVPPCVDYASGCKEIKKTLNYGRRVQIVDRTPCNHYLIGNESCERCCKLITLNRNLLSLHCAWHHQLLICSKCKTTVSDLEHRVYKGSVHCEECFRRAKRLHGEEYRTVHKN